MQERIKKIMAHYGLTASELAARLGVGKPLISHILSGRNNPSVMVLEKIAERFENLSLNWLITGKGEMHFRPAPPHEAQQQPKLQLQGDRLQDEDPAPYALPYKKEEEKGNLPDEEQRPHPPEGEKNNHPQPAPRAENTEKKQNVSRIIVVGTDGSVSLFAPEKL